MTFFPQLVAGPIVRAIDFVLSVEPKREAVPKWAGEEAYS